MPARIAAFIVWAAVAACGVFWSLRVLVVPRPVPSQAQAVSSADGQRGDVLRLFAAEAAPAGAAPAAPGLASRFKLIGVMAPKDGERGREQGVALIAVDDKPPRPFRVGAALDSALVLQAVATRSAVIGPPQGAPALQLDLPPLPAPATGSLPPAPSLTAPAAPAPAAPPAMPDAPPPSAVPAPDGAPPGGVRDPMSRR